NDAGRRTCSVKQIAKRLIREELGVVASEHDLLRTYHVDLVLDLDIEVVNRDAKVGETGLPDDSGRKCLRGFRNQLTCAAAGHDRGRDSEEEVLWYPVGSTVVCYALRDVAVCKFVAPQDARIGVPGRQRRARLPCEIQFVERRGAERGAKGAAQPERVGQGPVESRFIGRVAAIGLHVRVAHGSVQDQPFDEGFVRQQRDTDFAEHGGSGVVTRGDARAGCEPAVLGERDRPRRVYDLILLVQQPGRYGQAARGKLHDLAGNDAFHGPLRVLRG